MSEQKGLFIDLRGSRKIVKMALRMCRKALVDVLVRSSAPLRPAGWFPNLSSHRDGQSGAVQQENPMFPFPPRPLFDLTALVAASLVSTLIIHLASKPTIIVPHDRASPH
jgi:hypothetical protein